MLSLCGQFICTNSWTLTSYTAATHAWNYCGGMAGCLLTCVTIQQKQYHVQLNLVWIWRFSRFPHTFVVPHWIIRYSNFILTPTSSFVCAIDATAVSSPSLQRRAQEHCKMSSLALAKNPSQFQVKYLVKQKGRWMQHRHTHSFTVSITSSTFLVANNTSGVIVRVVSVDCLRCIVS